MRAVEIRVRKGDGQEVLFTTTCTAPPEAVWRVLSRVSEHLEWAGNRQSKHSRLVSIDGPDRELREGDEFTSTGVELGGRWSDRSRVVEAVAPRLLVFETSGMLQPPKGRAASSLWGHRYEIEPLDGGSRIRYAITRVQMDPPPLLLRIPPLEGFMFRAGKRASLHGLRELARVTEERTSTREHP